MTTPRRRRMWLLGLVLIGVVVSVGLALRAFEENMLYFFSPSQVVAGEAPTERAFRLGGLVLEDSVAREQGSLTVEFVVTDNVHSVPVQYTGALPDLFQEGKGVVTLGRFDANGDFIAEQVLAKHDENYMPPEVAAALDRATQAERGAGPR
ncbi:MAG TPA: cytochrome c maturation protein CcmE [Gammaproteobacteria bacterium]